MKFSTNKDYREQTKHQTLGFPLALYNNILTQNSYDELPLHWHPEFQICWVFEGSLEFIVADKHYQLTPAQGLLLNSSCLHSAKPLTPKVNYLCLNFAPDFVNQSFYQNVIRPLKNDPSFSAIPLTLVSQQITWLTKMAKTPDFLQIYSFLLQILDFAKNYALHDLNSVDPVIYELLDFVHEHYQENITLTQIAQSGPINKNKCTELFKKFTQMSPINYLINYRLVQAKELLLTTELRVADICYQVGFNNLSYFSAKFKQKFTLPPKKFRSKYQLNK